MDRLLQRATTRMCCIDQLAQSGWLFLSPCMQARSTSDGFLTCRTRAVASKPQGDCLTMFPQEPKGQPEGSSKERMAPSKGGSTHVTQARAQAQRAKLETQKKERLQQ